MSSYFLDVAVLPSPNLVFFPNAELSLSIVDPRHVQMVRECIKHDRLLAISLIDLKGGYTNLYNSPRAICTAGQPIIISEHESSLKILLQGQTRVKLLSLKQSLPYMLYRCEVIPDLMTKNDSIENASLEKLYENLKAWTRDNIVDSLEREVFLSKMNNINRILDAISMFMVIDPEIRQLLLENVHLGERLQILSSLFNTQEHHHEDVQVAEALKRYEAMQPDEFKIAH